MHHTITTIYCLCDELLRAMEHRDDRQSRLSSSEILTIALVSAMYFGGNFERGRIFLHEHGYIRTCLSRSRFNRRLHALPSTCWETFFSLLAQCFKENNSSADYVIDSIPIPVCDNIRINRCRLVKEEMYRGYCASKRRYFYGFKIHLLITGKGQPVEFVLTPGSTSDTSALKLLPLELSPGAIIHGDRAYNDYQEEDLLRECGGITLQPQRKKNSKRPLPLWEEFLSKPIRQRVETTFSALTSMFPKHIHAVTKRGFVIKLVCFLIALAIKAG